MAESETMLVGGARVQTSFTEEDLELAQSVRGLIGRRLERLSEPAQRMLVAAAVVGRDFDIGPLERVYGKSSSERASEIGHHLYQAGTAADPLRTATFLGQAAKNALAVG